MIVFVTAPGHAYTVASLVRGTYGAATPPVGTAAYPALFLADAIPRATYVFTDQERLTPAERALAAACYAAMTAAGLRCLNDPARIPGRYSLLRALAAAGINAHTAWRADERPSPRRFPVFIRREDGHHPPLGGLIATKDALERRLAEIAASGEALSGLIVVEFNAEPVADGVWRKFGSFRVAGGFHADHCDFEGSWLVKLGDDALATDERLAAEYAFVRDNAVPPAVKDAFALAAIDYGRADHAIVGGVPVIFEINTNPLLLPLTPQASPMRDTAKREGRRRMATLLEAIDTPAGGPVAIEPPEALLDWRRRRRAAGDPPPP